MAYRKSDKSRSSRTKTASKKRFSGKRKRPSFSKPGYRGRPQRRVKKFDPSQFIKKVEEQITTQAYIPKNTFSDFVMEEIIKKNIQSKGYENPTPIQDEAIPFLLEGRDIVATANTGTGKTAAFLIPLVNNVLTKKTDHVLIIAPTRELAAQIETEFKSFAQKTELRSVLCIGGANMNRQINALRKNPEFVIGTPGRLIDLEKNRVLQFNKYHSIVLDEVDRMLDMGFIKDINYIIDRLPKKRHSLFFSATIPAGIKKVVDSFLQNPVSISVKARQSSENVNQSVIKVDPKKKVDILHDLLIKPEFQKTLVFLRTKRGADKLARMLRERGFSVSAIHGDKTQAQRSKALLLFKKGKIPILLATDVVARGIDIDDISHVINYDLPETHEDYIHRIGRTGRAGKIGQAITFIE